VLKKAGIVVATAAAGLLAVSPLAFAGDYEGNSGDHGGHHHSHGDHHSKGASCKQDNSADQSGDNKQRGLLLNLQNTNVQVPVQACNNSVVEGVLGILAKDQRNKDNHGK
jgi:hypothetical protein